MTNGGNGDKWLNRSATVAMLLTAMGGLFLWALTQQAALTTLQERQRVEEERNKEQDKRFGDARIEIVRRLEVIDQKVTDMQVTNARFYGLQPSPRYDK